MWAQLITTSLKPGCEGELPRLEAALREAEQPDSGPAGYDGATHVPEQLDHPLAGQTFPATKEA